MNAKNSDLKRVQELYAVIQETKRRIKEFEITKQEFLEDDSVRNRMIADGLLMCVFRATEEAGNMSEEVKAAYPGIEWSGIHTMRNILAHDYGSADRVIIWASIEYDFPELEQFCIAYCGILSRYTLCGTGTTSKMVSEATGLEIQRFLSGAQGGDQQIAARIACNEIDLLLFFRDPLNPKSHETANDMNLLRLCDMHNIPVATNIATAEVLIHGLERGDLDWRNILRD